MRRKSGTFIVKKLPNPNLGLKSKKTKIALCVRDMQVGGVEMAMLRTIDALRARGDVDVCVVTYVPVGLDMFRQWFAARPDIRLYSLYPAKWLGTRLVRFFPVRIVQHVMRDIYRWARRQMLGARHFGNADVFIDYYNFQFVREFKRLQGTKIAWWHSSINVFWNQNAARYMDGYDRLVLLTDGAADEFKTRLPRYVNRVRRIYNPVDVHEIQAMATKAPLPTGDYFCCVSRLSADKDIQTILDAFDMFWRAASRPDVQLILVGDGHMAAILRDHASGLAAGKQIVFAGAQTNPFGYMRGAMAHILSSYGEGMGIVLIEASACGTLNIASDCKNGPLEILMNGAAGILFTPGDTAALARAMDDVWNGRVNRQEMIDYATAGLIRFDSKKIADDIMDMINSVALDTGCA